MRKRIKKRMITSNKNAVFAINVFDSKNSLLLDILGDPNDDVKDESEGPDDDDDDDDE
jgi:hypothetical protein